MLVKQMMLQKHKAFIIIKYNFHVLCYFDDISFVCECIQKIYQNLLFMSLNCFFKSLQLSFSSFQLYDFSSAGLTFWINKFGLTNFIIILFDFEKRNVKIVLLERLQFVPQKFRKREECFYRKDMKIKILIRQLEEGYVL